MLNRFKNSPQFICDAAKKELLQKLLIKIYCQQRFFESNKLHRAGASAGQLRTNVMFLENLTSELITQSPNSNSVIGTNFECPSKIRYIR